MMNTKEILFEKQGEYTLADYYALTEEQRVELIDGIFYDMDTPGLRHQAIVGELLVKINNYVQNYPEECMAIIGPVDVKLDGDDKTVVQPDVIIICHREPSDQTPSKPSNTSPDLVICFAELSEYLKKLSDDGFFTDEERPVRINAIGEN